MNTSMLGSLIIYCFVNSITPGPANLCSLAASINYGRKRALKQWTGLFTGFAIVSFASMLIAYFIGTALGAYVKWISYIGAAYIIFLAIKLLLSSPSENDGQSEKGCNFFTGLIVQLTNVKIMLYCLSVFAIYVIPSTSRFSVFILVAALLPFTGPIANLVWLFAGDALRKIFATHRKILNIIMAIALIFCAVRIIL